MKTGSRLEVDWKQTGTNWKETGTKVVQPNFEVVRTLHRKKKIDTKMYSWKLVESG